MDFSHYNSIHFVGIKGVAMTALAIIAQEKGVRVTGSDVAEEFPTDATLRRFRLPVSLDFSPQHIGFDVDLVIYTGAHQGAANIEVVAAATRGIPTLPAGKALGLFMEGKRGISVAGSHGKTTTSAMIAYALVETRYDPSFAIGCGELTNLKTPAHAGKGDLFVAEADEYATDPGKDQTPKFMWQNPEVAVITNIDFDHPDVYKNLDEVKRAFVLFANKTSRLVVVNSDDPAIRDILPRIHKKIITYGQAKGADYRITEITSGMQETRFAVQHKRENLGHFTLKIPGTHNATNATAVIASLAELGVPLTRIKTGLSLFRGTKRRFELVAVTHGKLLYDDYAHHPAEISATLTACREWYPKRRLVAVFQPHTYSRTRALLADFAKSLRQADAVVVTEIYASARETPPVEFSGYNLYEETKRLKSNVYFAPKKNDMLQYLQANTQPEDLIITMGAGDIFTWLPAAVAVL